MMLSDVCLYVADVGCLSLAYIGPKSRTERRGLGRLKLAQR